MRRKEKVLGIAAEIEASHISKQASKKSFLKSFIKGFKNSNGIELPGKIKNWNNFGQFTGSNLTKGYNFVRKNPKKSLAIGAGGALAYNAFTPKQPDQGRH